MNAIKTSIPTLALAAILIAVLPGAFAGPTRDDPAAAWLERQKGTVPAPLYDLLARSQATLLADIAKPGDVPPAGGTTGGRKPSEAGKPLPWAPLRGIYPSPFTYRGVWNWDGAFHAMAVARWDPELAREQVEIITRHQTEQGAFPDVVMEDGEVVLDFTKPPVLPWACRRIDELAPDDGFLSEIYPKLVANEKFWASARGGSKDGLFHYGGANPKFESGWDNSVRWDRGVENLWTVDLNCYMMTFYESMAYMAGRLGRPAERADWLDRSAGLGKRIEETLWNEAAGAYMDRDRNTGKFSGVLSPASFMPLFVGTASPDRARKMAGLAADPARFYPGMPSVSYDHPEYRSSQYWRGPTWINVTAMAIQGLKRFGQDRVADGIRETVFEWCGKNRDHLWEYYDSKTGKGLGAPQYGWTAAFLIDLILDWGKRG